VVDSTIKISEAPKTFMDCVKQAASATRTALNDGKKLIEVEFPPLPLEVLEDSSSSARDITEANTKWATEFAKYFVEMGKISIIYPDQPELDDAIKYVGDDDIGENVTLATIRADSIKNAQTLDQIFSSIFGATVGGTVVTVPNTAMYIALVSSTQELPDLEKLYLADPKIPIVFFNLRLDVLVMQLYDYLIYMNNILFCTARRFRVAPFPRKGLTSSFFIKNSSSVLHAK
jgi:hypothetical protein